MLIEDLKKKYDSKPINEVESDCKKNADSASDNRKEFILGLYYLDRTKRYKENPVYAKSTLETYIRSMCNLRKATYEKERFAFISHPSSAKKWGVGLISRIQKSCGAGNVPNIMLKINAIPNATHDKIEKVIIQNSKPRPDNKVQVETKINLESDNIRKGKAIAEYIQTINEKDTQIARMRETIMNLKAENEILKNEINKYRQGVSLVAQIPMIHDFLAQAAA